jgi:hypothetical protein
MGGGGAAGEEWGGEMVTELLHTMHAEEMTSSLLECLRHVAQQNKNACAQRLLVHLAEALVRQNDRVRTLEARCKGYEAALQQIGSGEPPV